MKKAFQLKDTGFPPRGANRCESPHLERLCFAGAHFTDRTTTRSGWPIY